MDSDYNDTLAKLKSVFGGSETKMLAERLHIFLKDKKVITVMDVGSGNLSGIASLATALQAYDISLDVDAIDIYEPELIAPLPSNVRVTMINEDFMKLPIKKRYDLVLCCQALYYFRNAKETVKRMIEHITPDGIVIVVVWDEGCYLRELSKSVNQNGQAPGLCGQKLEIIGAALNLNTVCLRFNGDINIREYKKLDSNLIPLAKFISRGPLTKEKMEVLVDKLSKCNEVVTRANVIVFYKLNGHEGKITGTNL